MTVREHLKKVHKAMAEHHLRKVARNTKRAGDFAKLSSFYKSDLEGGEREGLAGVLQNIADGYKEDSADHQSQADFHLAEMERCSKGMDSDLDKTVPDRISRIVPEPPGGVRPVFGPASPISAPAAARSPRPFRRNSRSSSPSRKMNKSSAVMEG